MINTLTNVIAYKMDENIIVKVKYQITKRIFCNVSDQTSLVPVKNEQPDDKNDIIMMYKLTRKIQQKI